MTKVFLSMLFIFSIAANASDQNTTTLEGQGYGFLDEYEPYPQQVIIEIEKRADNNATNGCIHGIVTRISDYAIEKTRYIRAYRFGWYVVATASYSCDKNNIQQSCEEECSGLIGQWGYSACVKSCKNGTGEPL